MKKIIVLFLFCTTLFAQTNDSLPKFKKPVQENIEAEILLSYYKQEGIHSAVSGGIGNENLTDTASDIIVSIPMNEDDVLTIDVGISAYTSASSSNTNPFNKSGASEPGVSNIPKGSPWMASSGASASDQLVSVNANYSHSTDDRNLVWNADVSFSNEYDYTSIGFGGGVTKLFNKKNTELGIKANVYLDQWRPIYPTELHEYSLYGDDYLSNGYFNNGILYNQDQAVSFNYKPSKFEVASQTNRNSYSTSVSFSQILTKKLQFSMFFDLVLQQGMLATPYHRIYFADKENYYVGYKEYIPVYTTAANEGVYHLADDVEQLPSSRTKFPIGFRLNYYANEYLKIRSYYRYYVDNWGITAYTAQLEIPLKIAERFTVYPSYRYYSQQGSKYFAAYDTHLSTADYYTSDYDLSTFNSHQIGGGIAYTDLLTNFKIWKFGLKNIDLRYQHYKRSDTLYTNIFTLGCKFML